MASRFSPYILPMGNLAIREDLSPDSMTGMESQSYMDPIHAHPDALDQRQVYLEGRLASLGKRASGYNAYQMIDDNPHGTGYCPMNLPPTPTHADVSDPFQIPFISYASSTSSFAGDRSTDHTPSYGCASPVPTNASASSPRPSESQYPDPAGSPGRGLELARARSVRPQDVQPFPQQFVTQFDDGNAGYGRGFSSERGSSADGSMTPVDGHGHGSPHGDHCASPGCETYAIDPALGHGQHHMPSHSFATSHATTMPPPPKRQRSSPQDGQLSAVPPYRSAQSSQPQSPTAHSSAPARTTVPSSPSGGNTRQVTAGGQQRGNSAANRRAAVHRRKPSTSVAKAPQQTSNKIVYECSFAAYGCSSTFTSKNEWKRHVSTIHLRLGVYHCKLCMQNNPIQADPHGNTVAAPAGGTTISYPAASVKTYNRKDLFAQHLRRMHSPWPSPKYKPTSDEENSFEQGLKPIYEDCKTQRNPPQQSQCTFCTYEASGAQCWEDRMEHVSKHFEKGEQQIREDAPLRDWALQEGIIKVEGRKIVLAELQGSRKRKA